MVYTGYSVVEIWKDCGTCLGTGWVETKDSTNEEQEQ